VGDFNSADFFDARDSEHVTCTDPASAIVEYLEINLGESATEAEIRGWCPITVVAYKRRAMPPDFPRRLADHFAEWTIEQYADDGVDPDGDYSALEKRIADAIDVALRTALADVTNWGCESAGECAFNADEVVAMMREAEYLQEEADRG
jgi:hypothetical protein